MKNIDDINGIIEKVSSKLPLLSYGLRQCEWKIVSPSLIQVTRIHWQVGTMKAIHLVQDLVSWNDSITIKINCCDVF